MSRMFFGVLALASGLGTLHFTSRWLQFNDVAGCYGNSTCRDRTVRGGMSQPDRRNATGLFCLTGVLIFMAGQRQQS